MKPKALAVFIAVMLITVGLALARTDGEQSGEVDELLAGRVTLSVAGNEKKLLEGQIPPDFFIIKDGDITTLSNIKENNYVFINFWNTWCPPCREEMPDLNKLYLEFQESNVEFLFVNITVQEKTVAEVTQFLTENEYTLPVYLDHQGEIAGTYGVGPIPATLVLNPKGEIIYASAGMISYENARGLLTGQ